MKTEDYYAIPVNDDGWRVLPNGNRFKIGNEAKIGNWAKIGNEAEIGNEAKIGNGAKIGNWAKIGTGTVWKKSPLAIQGTRHLATNGTPGMIQIGCCEFTFAYWTEHVLGIACQNGYTELEGLEYQRIVAFIVANGVPAEVKKDE